MYRTTVFLLAGFVFLFGTGPLSAHAQQTESSIQFNVSEPPSGILGQEQLEEIAGTIRQLERHPMAEGADKARATLVQWLQASPDVTVRLCPEISAPLANPDSRALRRSVQQHLLSTAAYSIEHPESDNLVAAKLSGLKGALRVYEASARRKEGPRKKRSPRKRRAQKEQQADIEAPIHQLLQMREEGTLKKYVEQGIQSCQDAG